MPSTLLDNGCPCKSYRYAVLDSAKWNAESSEDHENFWNTVAIISGWLWEKELVRTFESPDGNHRIEVWAHIRTLTSPGDAGQDPGKVLLLDRNGKVLESSKVHIADIIDTVTWKEDRVNIRGVAA